MSGRSGPDALSGRVHASLSRAFPEDFDRRTRLFISLPDGCRLFSSLSDLRVSPVHAFWPDDIRLFDNSLFDPGKIHGPGQLTDLYLLALAIRHEGRFVTFDRTLPAEAVHGFHQSSLVIL